MPKSLKSQVSLEYMIIVGFTTFVIITLIALSYTYSKDVDDQVALNQADRIVKSIVDSAESVYYFGEPSKVEISANFPKSIESIAIANNEVVFTLRTQTGLNSAFKKSSVNISGILPISYGYHNIAIEAKDNYVWVNST